MLFRLTPPVGQNRISANGPENPFSSETPPTAVAGLLLVILPALGWVYLIPVLLVTIDLVRKNLRLIRKPEPDQARSLFLASNLYLLVLLLAVCAGSLTAAMT